MLHKYPLNAGTLAAIAKQFNPVLALHAIILAEAARRVYPGETFGRADRQLRRNRLPGSQSSFQNGGQRDLGGCRLAPGAQGMHLFGRHIGVL